MMESQQVSDPETATKASDPKMTPAAPSTTKDDTPATKNITKAEASAFEWEEVKKARWRNYSQRIRERERAQIANLEAERARLWLSNDAIRFQNQHFRQEIAKILEIRKMKRNRVALANGGMGMLGAGAPGPSAALLGGLGGGMHMMAGRAGGLDASGLFQNTRLTGPAGKGLRDLSDAELLARHQATSMEVQNMVRKQEAMGGMGGLGLNNGMNMNAVAGSPYAEMAESIRIRQLMLQQAGGAQADGILSGNAVGGAGNIGDFGSAGTGNGLSALGGTGLGDLGNGGMDNADLFSMNKRQKLGF